jgi:succinate dehydrogenase / fumarate reductase membrane anchor subunit
VSAHKQETIRTPLGRARGLGSAKDGTHHWIMMRVTSILLLPLSVYFLFQLRYFLPEPRLYTNLIVQLADPVTALALVLFILSGFYHACLGVQTIIEDYVHGEGMKIFLLFLNKIAFFVLGTAGIFAVAYITFALYGGTAGE